MTGVLISPLYLLEQTGNGPYKVENRESLYDVPKNLRMSTEAKKTNVTEAFRDSAILDTKPATQIDETKNNIKEETNVNPKQSLVSKIKREWQLIIKIIELIINALSFGFFFEPARKSTNLANRHLEQVVIIFLAFAGYILINAVFIVSRCIKDKIPYRVSVLFSAVASILNFIAGILIIVDRHSKFQLMHYEPYRHMNDLLITVTALSFINSLLYGIDAIYTFNSKQDF